jgi:hypothetical protein
MANGQYFPRAAAVKATKLIAGTSAFIIAFNNGRTGYPFAIDNGKGIFIVTGPGIATEIQVGSWVVENGNGVEFYDDAKFCGDFTPGS